MGNTTSSETTSGSSSGSSFLKYEPQPDLRGHLELDGPINEDDDDPDCEVLVATFKFEACKWEKPPWSARERPIPVGMVEGLGHVTNRRLVLFWDVGGALSGGIIDKGGEVICV